MQAAKCTNHYDNKTLIQLCNSNKKKCLSERSKPDSFCKLGSNSRARAIHLKGRDKPSLTFLYNNYKWIGSLHTHTKKKNVKAFTVKATRLQ